MKIIATFRQKIEAKIHRQFRAKPTRCTYSFVWVVQQPVSYELCVCFFLICNVCIFVIVAIVMSVYHLVCFFVCVSIFVIHCVWIFLYLVDKYCVQYGELVRENKTKKELLDCKWWYSWLVGRFGRIWSFRKVN